MDFPIYIDTISLELLILHLKWSQVEFSKLWYISVPKSYFNFSFEHILMSNENAPPTKMTKSV